MPVIEASALYNCHSGKTVTIFSCNLADWWRNKMVRCYFSGDEPRSHWVHHSWHWHLIRSSLILWSQHLNQMSGEFLKKSTEMMSWLSFLFCASIQFPPHLFTHLHPFLPADPQVTPGEETRHCMPGQVMDPALLPQLSHDGVYPGKARLGLRPLGERLWVFVPGDAYADGVAIHLVEARVIGRRSVEELTPQ